MGGRLGKGVDYLIFFEDEDLDMGEVRRGDIILNLGLLSFFGDDKSVYLPGKDILLSEVSPSTGLFLVSSSFFSIMNSFLFL